MLCAREVLGVEQREKFRIAQKIVPGEVDQPPDRFERIEMLEIQRSFLCADLFIGAFEDGKLELVLLANLVIQHTLVGAGLGRDPVDPRTGKAMGCELLLGSLENAMSHALWVALPL